MSKKGKHQEEVAALPVFDPVVYVHLRAADGHEVLLDRNCARISKLIKYALAEHQRHKDERAQESQGVVIAAAAAPGPMPLAFQDVMTSDDDVSGLPKVTLPFVSGAQLELLARFMHYKYRYDNDPDHRYPWPLGDSNFEAAQVAALATIVQL